MSAVSPNRRPLFVAVILSFLTFWVFAWIRGGVAATPYTATDSLGRTMGFNDVFSAEHYGIILRNADVRHTLQVLTEDDMRIQHWALIAAHLAMLALLAKAGARTIRWFLCVQPVFFFWGWFGFWVLPIAVYDLLWGHTSDREGFVDIPYVAIMSQGAWFLACGFIFWKLRPRRRAVTASSHAAVA
jgi:hypothetical protein